MLYNVTKVYVLNSQVLYVDEGEISRDSSNFNQIDVITNVSGFGVEIAFKLPNGVFSDRIGLIQQTGTVIVPSDIKELESVEGQSWSTYTMLIDNAVLSAITSTTSQTLEFAVRFSNQITNLLVFDKLTDFPTTGEGDKVYQADDSKQYYIWNGTAYVTRTNQQADAIIITEGQVYTTEPGFLSIQGTIGGEPVALDPAFYQNKIVSSFNNLVSLYNAINNAITDGATGLPAIAGKVAKAGDTMTGALQFSNAEATRLIMGNNNVTTDAGINATTFKNGDLTSDAVKISNFAQLFAVTPATPGQGETHLDTVTAALTAKFAGILSEAQLNAIYLRRDGSGSMSGNLNMGGNQITSVGNVDGVNISALKSTTDNHIAATNNPHSVTAAQTGAYTTVQTDNLLDGKANSSHNHPITDVTNLQDTLTTLSNNISALSGSFIFRGVVSNTTAQVTADTELLTTRIDELLNREPQTGDVLKDTDGGEWYYDGGAWRFVGQSFVDLTPYLKTTDANDTFETITNIGNRTYDENNVVADAESVTASINKLDIEIATKVDKVENKGLSEEDFTTTLKNKLNGIDDGAEVNVQANFTELDSNSDAFILNVPSDFPPSSHTHIITDVTDLQTGLDGKEPTFTKNAAFNKDFGTTANTVTEGDDERLSDARTPLAHNHVISDVTDLQTALDSKPTIDSVTGKIPASVIPLQFEDVLQGFYATSLDKFFEEVESENEIVGEQGKLYIDIPTNRLFRFDGTGFIVVIDAAEINSLNDIPDVSITSVANDEALVYNTATDKWENQAIPRTVDTLEDTTITTAADGEVLIYNGSEWVNAELPTQDLDDLTDVVITTPVANNLLVHDGTNFINQAGTSTLVGLNNVQNFGIASQAEAEAGTSDEKYMTPLRTAQAIAELGGASEDPTILLEAPNLLTFGFNDFIVVVVEPTQVAENMSLQVRIDDGNFQTALITSTGESGAFLFPNLTNNETYKIDARTIVTSFVPSISTANVLVSDNSTVANALSDNGLAINAISKQNFVFSGGLTILGYLIENQTTLTALVASTTAMTIIAASQTGITTFAESIIGLTAIAQSTTAMNAVANSTTALSATFATGPRREILWDNTPAFTILMDDSNLSREFMLNNFSEQHESTGLTASTFTSVHTGKSFVLQHRLNAVFDTNRRSGYRTLAEGGEVTVPNTLVFLNVSHRINNLETRQQSTTNTNNRKVILRFVKMSNIL